MFLVLVCRQFLSKVPVQLVQVIASVTVFEMIYNVSGGGVGNVKPYSLTQYTKHACSTFYVSPWSWMVRYTDMVFSISCVSHCILIGSDERMYSTKISIVSQLSA